MTTREALEEVAGILRWLQAGRPYWRRQAILSRRTDLAKLAVEVENVAKEANRLPARPVAVRVLCPSGGWLTFANVVEAAVHAEGCAHGAGIHEYRLTVTIKAAETRCSRCGRVLCGWCWLFAHEHKPGGKKCTCGM